ncbi:NACHT domain-containing protein [Nonomuraea sp. NPDC048901]|uniref:NACHT domain-containing protein n=1 Tax=Nonomuraea sp. NPDC048901 TaxID=3155627 RepID=UPI0033D288A2
MHPELGELTSWFKQLLRAKNHSVRSFILSVQRQGLPIQVNPVYEFLRGERLLDWKLTCLMARALGQTAEVAEPMWTRAKRAMDLKPTSEKLHIATWQDLPPLDARLREFFLSQGDAVDRFPYDLLDVNRPPLADVYVEQGVHPIPLAEIHETSTQVERPPKYNQRDIPFPYALAKHDHLFITGGPGTGKTTLARLLVRQIARTWIEGPFEETPWCPEPVIAISITAAEVLTGSWGQVLANASYASALTVPFEPQIFAQTTYGVRWLVVVDGLDEIPSPRDRARVLNVLSMRIEHGTPYRLIITSRPLPQDELSPFQGRAIGFYALRGFDEEQQQTFAERWFAAQGAPETDGLAQAFLQQARVAGLSELMRVPLLATIAATFFSRHPTKSLPRGRIDLYERFLDELSAVRGHRSDLRSRIRERWEEVGCADIAEWIFANQESLILHLAESELKLLGKESLLAAASNWTRAHLPAELRMPEGIEDDLGRLLGATSILIFDGKLSFLHRSFAEFIAARAAAAALPSEFSDLAEWTGRIRSEATRNFAFFALAHWARKSNNKIATIVRLLLAQDLQHKIMALRLVTAGVPLGLELEDAAIDRLLGSIVETNHLRSSDERALFDELSELRGNERLARRLSTLARTRELNPSIRVVAAAAYARVSNVSGSLDLLYELTDMEDPDGLANLITHLSELDASATGVRIQLLERLLVLGGTWRKVWACSELADLGRTTGVADLASAVLSGPDQNGDLLEFAAEVWEFVEGSSALDAIDAAIKKRQHSNEWAHAGIANIYFRLGSRELAEPHAREVLLTGTDEEGIQSVVQSWVESCGAAGATTIVKIASTHSCWNSDVRPLIARQLLELGYSDDAVNLARAILQNPSSHGGVEFLDPIRVLVSVYGASATDEIISWLREADHGPFELHWAMRHLVDQGLGQAASMFASRIISDPGSPRESFIEAADILLEENGGEALDHIMDMLRLRPAGCAPLSAELTPILAKHRQVDAVVKLCRLAMYDAGRTLEELKVAIRSWISAAGGDALPEVIALTEAVCSLSGDERMELADLFEEVGQVKGAIELWCKVCADYSHGLDIRWRAAERLLSVNAANIVYKILKDALTAAHDEVEIRRLEQLIGWVKPNTSS